MFKKAITFKNIDGQTVTEDFYFNMTKLEFSKQILRAGVGTGETDPEKAVEAYGDRFKKIGESGNPLLIIETFEEMVKASIGKRTDDGLFLKTKEYADAFCTSEAFSNLIDELITDAGKATEFTNGLMPESMLKSAETARAQSESRMQGFQQKQEPTIQNVELPIANPVVEEAVRDEAAQMAAFQAWQAQQKASQEA